MRIRWPRLSWRGVVVVMVYVLVLFLQLFMWPVCEEDQSFSLIEELERGADLESSPLPSNLLNPPMWSHDPHTSRQCGSWQKDYTYFHRDMMSSEQPPFYLVYTTGQGFPPFIQGVPQALKGIATVFMLALLTDRAFLLDWKSPAGFEQVLVPRYIDWRHDMHFGDAEEDDRTLHRAHNIGTTTWYQGWNDSKFLSFYTETDFNDYFSKEKEVIQSHSYDFTYALLRNKHHREKARALGLHRVKCLVCCFWSYLFKQSPTFVRNSAMVARKTLGLTKGRDLIFIDLSFPRAHVKKSLQMEMAREAFKCVDKIKNVLQNPVCILASNSYFLLEEVPKFYPRANSNKGLFFSKERYHLDLQRKLDPNGQVLHSRNSGGGIVIPKSEPKALMYFFMGYFLQLNSTVLLTSQHSPYSETMAAFKHFYHPSGTYLIHSGGACKLDKFQG